VISIVAVGNAARISRSMSAASIAMPPAAPALAPREI
jgi:hypothetical protein